MLIPHRPKCKILVHSSLCFGVNQLDLRQSLGMVGDGLLLGPLLAASMNVAASVVVLCLAQSSSAVPAPLVPRALLVLNKHHLHEGQSCLLIQGTPALPQINVPGITRSNFVAWCPWYPGCLGRAEMNLSHNLPGAAPAAPHCTEQFSTLRHLSRPPAPRLQALMRDVGELSTVATWHR